MKALALFVLASCDQLVGLQHLPPGTDALDAPTGLPATVHGTYILHYVQNTPSGAAMTGDVPYAASDIHAKVKVDGAETDVSVDDHGVFSFDVAHEGERYQLAFVTPHANVDYQLSTIQLSLVEGLTGSPTQSVAPAGTTFTLSVTGRPSGELSEEWGTLGLFTRTVITPVGAAIGGAWPTGVLDAAEGDKIYYLASIIDTDTTGHGYARANSVGILPATVASGANPFTVAPQPVAQTPCSITAHYQAEIDRLDPALPNRRGGWSISAVPDLQLGNVITFPMAYLSAGPAGLDVTNTVKYGNPFAYPLTAVLTAERDDGVTFALNETLAPLTAGCPGGIDVPSGVVAIPTQVALDDIAITAQTSSITIDRTRDVTLTWRRSADGEVSYYVIIINELVGSAHIEQHRVVTTTTSALVAPDMFVAGHSYVIDVAAVTGYLQANDGDFRFFTPPNALAELRAYPFVAN